MPRSAKLKQNAAPRCKLVERMRIDSEAFFNQLVDVAGQARVVYLMHPSLPLFFS